jgi:hypothetical protein
MYERIQKALQEFSAKYNVTPQVQRNIMDDVRNDLILPDLAPDSTLEFEIGKDEAGPCGIRLTFGNREMAWEDGELVDTGFWLSPPPSEVN